jgi:hypothetical protein
MPDTFAEQCLNWKKRGLIPGPQETEEAFLARVSQVSSSEGQEDWEGAHQVTQKLFDFSIDWVPVSFSNQKLPFWEGAATWIDAMPSIQVREGFKKGRYLGYELTEVLAHEFVHVARTAFEEPEFEELLAYQTSRSWFRRKLGPAFQKPWESLAFVLSLGIASFGHLWLPLLLIGGLGTRLVRAHRMLGQCLGKMPLSFVLCLTDQEIKTFARLSLADIEAYLKQDQSFRGSFLSATWSR